MRSYNICFIGEMIKTSKVLPQYSTSFVALKQIPFGKKDLEKRMADFGYLHSFYYSILGISG